MKDEEILEGNKLIAEFDNIWFMEETGFPPEKLEYHSSWNWLMPVIEKIENIEFIGKVSIQYYTLFSGIACYNIQIGRDSESNKTPDSFPIEVVEFLKYGTEKTKIQAVYKAVVEFIKWYNKNLKS